MSDLFYQTAHFLFHFTKSSWEHDMQRYSFFPMKITILSVNICCLCFYNCHDPNSVIWKWSYCQNNVFSSFIIDLFSENRGLDDGEWKSGKNERYLQIWLVLSQHPAFDDGVYQCIKTDLQMISRTPRTWEAILQPKWSCHSSPSPVPLQSRTNPTKFCLSEYSCLVFVSEKTFFPHKHQVI